MRNIVAGMLLALFVAMGASLAAAGEWYDQGDANVDATIWGGLSGIRIQPSATNAGAVAIEVKDGTATVNGNLTMSALNAEEEDSEAGVSLKLDATVNPVDVTFTGGAYMLATDSSKAELTVTAGARLGFGGTSYLYATADSGTASTSNLLVTVEGTGSSLTFGDVYISDLTAQFPASGEAPDPSGYDSTVHIKDGGALVVSGMLAMENGRITVENASATIGTFSMGTSSPVRGNEFNVGAGGVFLATDVNNESYIGYGKFKIDAAATSVGFHGGLHVGEEGKIYVPLSVDLGTKGVTISRGGHVEVGSGGELAGTYYNITNGRLDAWAGSLIGGTDSFTVSGDDSHVYLDGGMTAGTKMTLSGGHISFFTNFNTVGGDLGALNVGGTADVYMLSTVKTAGGVGSFSFLGGNITLNNYGHLDVASVGQELTMKGKLIFDGGRATFRDSLTWTNGGIYTNTTANMDMQGNRLGIASGGTMDVSEGALTINNSGGLSISGTYKAGYYVYGGNVVTMASSLGGGGLHLSSQASIQMSSALQRYVNSGALDRLGAIQVLETDGLSHSGVDTVSWNGGGYVYHYEVRQNSNGQWGIYLVNAEKRTDLEQYNDLLAAWRPKVGADVSKVINNRFAGAIIRANGIVTGESGDYDALSKSGKFNADALSSLLQPVNSGAGYDALMLYNGSGLGMVNQAVINSNQRLMKRFEQRNNHLRHELDVASETLDSCSAYAAQVMNEDYIQRFWVAGNYTNDNAGRDEGFAGYHYRTTGAVVGYDHLFGNLAVGGAFSYSGGDFEDSAALANDSYINTYGFHLYGSYNAPSGWFVNGAAGYAYSDNQIRDYRFLNGFKGWNTADYHTDSYMVAANVGKDYKPLDYLTVTGSMGLAYQHAANSDHSQYFRADGGGAAAATIEAHKVSNHSTTLPLDLTVAYDVIGDDSQLLTVYGNVGYAYEFNNTGAEGKITYAGLGNVGSVDIVSRHPGRHIMNVGVGMKYYYNQFEFGASYDYTSRKKYNSHHFIGNVGIVF